MEFREKMPQMVFLGSFSDVTKIPHDLPQVCFTGRSNSGKSSLISSLCSNPSIVKTSRKPGHTRTLNVFQREDIYLIDMPGYGYAGISKKERDGLSDLIHNYLKETQNLYAGFLLLDCKRAPAEEEYYLLNLFRERGISLHLVLTKIDRFNQKENARLKKAIQDYEKDFSHVLAVSSHKGRNLDYLINFLKSLA